MAHFAHINKDGVVDQVVVGGTNFLDPQFGRNPDEWVQTSYNTSGGVHKDGGVPLRKNYAGVGFTYDKTLDAFIPPKPYASWTLDEEKCQWKAPIEKPKLEPLATWDEDTLSWKKTSEQVAVESLQGTVITK